MATASFESEVEIEEVSWEAVDCNLLLQIVLLQIR